MMEKKKQDYDALVDGIKDDKSNVDMVWDKVCEVWEDLTSRYPSYSANKRVDYIGRHIGEFMRLDDPKRFASQKPMTRQNVIKILNRRGLYSTERATDEAGADGKEMVTVFEVADQPIQEGGEQ